MAFAGPKNRTGDIGPEGPIGPRGPKGDIGPEGPIGPKGKAGKDGKDGVTKVVYYGGGVGGDSGTSQQQDDNESCVLMQQSCVVDSDGELLILDEACVAVKNGLADAASRINKIVTVLNTGEIEINNNATLEIQDGST